MNSDDIILSIKSVKTIQVLKMKFYSHEDISYLEKKKYIQHFVHRYRPTICTNTLKISQQTKREKKQINVTTTKLFFLVFRTKTFDLFRKYLSSNQTNEIITFVVQVIILTRVS